MLAALSIICHNKYLLFDMNKTFGVQDTFASMEPRSRCTISWRLPRGTLPMTLLSSGTSHMLLLEHKCSLSFAVNASLKHPPLRILRQSSKWSMKVNTLSSGIPPPIKVQGERDCIPFYFVYINVTEFLERPFLQGQWWTRRLKLHW